MLGALKERLVTDSGINAIISGRVSPIQGSQGTTYPDITYRVLDQDSVRSMDGISGLSMTTVELMLWARTYQEIDNLREKVRLRLDCFRGVVNDAGGTPTDFQYIEGRGWVDLPYDDVSRLYGCSMTFFIMHEEARS